MDAEACPDPALVGAAASGDATVVDATDAINHTTSPQTRLEHFTERITKAKQPPLLELPGDDTTHGGRAPPMLPKRSKRITAQSLSHIPASKRGEHLVSKRLGLANGMSSPSVSAMKTYDEIYSGDLGNMPALRELFPPATRA
jgi:hypothetical protein